MIPSFAKRYGNSFLPLEGAMQSEMFPGQAHFVAQQQSDLYPEIPSVAESLVDYQLARFVFEAHMRAQMRLSNFFHQGKVNERRLLDTVPVHPQQTMASSRQIMEPQMMCRNTSLSFVSDDGSSISERQFVNDSSENGSLGNSSRSACSSQQQRKIYIDTIRDTDVLCGRGGRSNHHPGNKRYRHVIGDMRTSYKKTEAKSNKTDLSRAIVDHVCQYGGRFIKKEETTGRYYVLTRGEARKKTSQALRENKALKWTM
mmetsp:Transcript_14458/g.27536  ORF Transcript_14458/g.27536 Transcript_14458/m.27536 type:complete len:257 (-) Transcript_14458:69-839(-)|eukprot:scaffold2992_cov214-Amphora_coffeaeformis.AAC.26